MRRLRLWVNILIFCLPLGYLLLQSVGYTRQILAFLSDEKRVATLLSTLLTEQIGRPVRIEGVEFHGDFRDVKRDNRLLLKNVSLFADTRKPNLPTLKVARIEVEFQRGQLLNEESLAIPRIRGLSLFQPEVHLERDTSGVYNISPLLQQLFAKPTTPQRAFVHSIHIRGGNASFQDALFPLPKHKPLLPLHTKLSGIDANILLHPDKSVTFEVNSEELEGFTKQIHLAGIVQPAPLSIQAEVRLQKVNLPETTRRLLPTEITAPSQGEGEIAARLSYAPQSPEDSFEVSAIQMEGDLHVQNLDWSWQVLRQPIQNLSSNIHFTKSSIDGVLTGNYGGMLTTVQGSLSHIPFLLPKNQPKPPFEYHAEGIIPQWDVSKTVQFPDLARLLSGTSPLVQEQVCTLQGKGELHASLHGVWGKPVLVATTLLPTLKNAKLSARNVQITASWSENQLHTALKGEIAKGQLSLQSQLGFTQGSDYRVDMQARGVEVATLKNLWKRDYASLALGGRANADTVFEGKVGVESRSETHVRVTDLKIQDQVLRSAAATVQTFGERLTLSQLRIDDARGFLIARGTANLNSHRLDFKVAADELDLGTLVALIPQKRATKVNAIPEPDASSETEALPVEGIAYLRGSKEPTARITGTLDDPRLLGRLTAFNVEFGKLESERIETLFDLTKDHLILNQGNILLTPGVIKLSGIVAGLDNIAKAPPSISLSAQAENIDINRLLTLSGIDPKQIQASGTLATDEISLMGTTRDISTRFPFKVYLSNTTLNDLPITQAEITLGYKQNRVEIPALLLHLAQGQIEGSGNIGPEKQIALNLTAQNLDIPSLLTTFVQNERTDALQGKLFGRMDVRGTSDAPIATLNLAAQGVNYLNYPFGNMTGTLRYHNKVATAEQVLLGELGGSEGRILIPQLQYDTEQRTLQGGLHWAGVSVKGIRDILQVLGHDETNSPERRSSLLSTSQSLASLEGVTTGDATLQGTPEKPEIALQWESIPLKLGDYGITITKGKGKMTRESASFPNIELQSEDGAVEIQAPEIAFGGNLAVDVTAVDVSLGFLKHWLTPKTSNNESSKSERRTFQDWLRDQGQTEVSGKGTLAISVRGKTTAPEIEQASLNLNQFQFSKLLSNGTREVLLGIDKLDFNDISLREGVIKSDSIALRYRDTVLRGNAEIQGFQWTAPFLPPDSRVKAAVRLVPRSDDEQNLQSLSRFFPNLLSKESVGRLLVSGSMEGTIEDPFKEVSGKIDLTSPRLQLRTISTGLTDVEGQMELSKGSLLVRSFKGKTRIFKENDYAKKNLGSPIMLTGSLPLGLSEDTLTNAQDAIHLKIKSLYFDETPLPGADSGAARGKADIDLQMVGSVKEPTIRGTVTFSETQFALPGEFAALTSTEAKPPSAPKFDIAFIAGNEVKLKNLLLDTRVEGKLLTTGSPADPRLDGQLRLLGGKLRLLTTRLNLQNPSTLALKYPLLVSGVPSFSLEVNLLAEASITVTSNFGGSGRRERASIRIVGPLTGAVTDPVTGESRLRITSNDPRIDSRTLMQTLLLGDTSIFKNLGSTPGQVLAHQLTNVFTGAVLPGVFDRSAEQLGFSELSIGYDPIQNVSLNISRHLFGPLYLSYSRSLAASRELFTFRASFRFQDRYQATYEVREQNEQRLLAEGVWRW